MQSRYFESLVDLIAALTPDQVATLRPELAGIESHPERFRIVGRGEDGEFSVALPDSQFFRNEVRTAAERARQDPPDFPDDTFQDRISTQLIIGDLRARAGLELAIGGNVALHYFGPKAQEFGAQIDAGTKRLVFNSNQLEEWKEIFVEAHEFDTATTLPSDPNTYEIRDEIKALGGKWDPERQAWHFHDPSLIRDQDSALRATEAAIWNYLYPVSSLENVPADRFIHPKKAEHKTWLQWGLKLAYSYGTPDEVLGLDTSDPRWIEKCGIANASRAIARAEEFVAQNARAAIRSAGRELHTSLADVDRIANLIPTGGRGMSVKEAIERVPALAGEVEKNSGIRQLLETAIEIEKSMHGSKIQLKREIDEIALTIRDGERGVVDFNRRTIEERVADRRRADVRLIAGETIEDQRDSHDTTERVQVTNAYSTREGLNAQQEVITRSVAQNHGPYGEHAADLRTALSHAKTEEEVALVKERGNVIRAACEYLDHYGLPKTEIALDREEGHYTGNLIAYTDNYFAMHLHKDGRGTFVVIPVDDISWDDFRETKKFRAAWTNKLDQTTQKPTIITVGYTAQLADMRKGEHSLYEIRKLAGRGLDVDRKAFVSATQDMLAKQGFPTAPIGVDRYQGLSVGPLVDISQSFLIQRVPNGIAVHALRDTLPAARAALEKWTKASKIVSVGYTDGRMDALLGEKTLDQIRDHYKRAPKDRHRAQTSRKTSGEVEQSIGTCENEYEADRRACNTQATALLAQKHGAPQSQIFEAAMRDGSFSGDCLVRTKFHVAQASLGTLFHTFEVVGFEPDRIPKVGEHFKVLVEHDMVKSLDVRTRSELAQLNGMRALHGEQPLDASELFAPTAVAKDEQARQNLLNDMRSIWRKQYGHSYDEVRELRANDIVRGRIVHFTENYLVTDVFANGKYDETRVAVHPRKGQLAERVFKDEDLGSEATIVYRKEASSPQQILLTEFIPASDLKLDAPEDIQKRIAESQRAQRSIGKTAVSEIGG